MWKLINIGEIINLDRTNKQQQKKVNDKKRKNKVIIDLTELLNPSNPSERLISNREQLAVLKAKFKTLILFDISIIHGWLLIYIFSILNI